MSADDREYAGRPILREAWNTMAPAARATVSSAPVIPQIAARAKAAAVRHPQMVRGDQGQVVGVMPEREVYYGPSSGLPELRELVARFWTLAYGLEGCEGVAGGGLGAEHAAIVSGATEGIAIVMGRFSAIPGSAFGAPGCIRFGYAGMPVKAIQRLGAALPEVLACISH